MASLLDQFKKQVGRAGAAAIGGTVGEAYDVQRTLADIFNRGDKAKPISIGGKAGSATSASSGPTRVDLVDKVMSRTGWDRSAAQGLVDRWHAQYGYPQHTPGFTQANVDAMFNQFVSKELAAKAGLAGGGFGGGDGATAQLLFTKMLAPYLDQSYKDYAGAIAGNDAALNATVNAVNLPPGFAGLFKANRARESAQQNQLNAALKQNTLVAPVWDELFRQISESRQQAQQNYWNTIGRQQGTTVNRDPVWQAGFGAASVGANPFSAALQTTGTTPTG